MLSEKSASAPRREAPDPSAGLRWKLHLTTALASLYVFAWWAMASRSTDWQRERNADATPVALAPVTQDVAVAQPLAQPLSSAPWAEKPPSPGVDSPVAQAAPAITRVASARRHRVRTRSS